MLTVAYVMCGPWSCVCWPRLGVYQEAQGCDIMGLQGWLSGIGERERGRPWEGRRGGLRVIQELAGSLKVEAETLDL